MRTQWLKRAAAIFCAAYLTLLSAAEVPAQELAVKEFAAKTNTARALEMQSKYGKYNCQVVGDTSRNVLYVMFVCGYDMLGITDALVLIL